MLNDHEIASAAVHRPIASLAEGLGLTPEQVRPYGTAVAKVDPAVLQGPRLRDGEPRLILVSALTPTKAGEGKTTTSIGLAQGLARIGERVCVALREPSLGPAFGIKGGATGGGYSQLLPRERINLHFTGDFHAVTSAHNLLAAILDNHIYFGNPLGIDPRRILWRRVMDMNDRALRHIIVGLGGRKQGVPRETGFDITAASEVMAMLCLAEGEDDLRERIERTLVAFGYDGKPVTAARLCVSGAMLALLRDALWPNLVQTLEGVPTLVHGGPFANIAHGCSSVIATRMAMHLADWTVTEAGFGFDLGGEKFYDIKCRAAGLDTAAVVMVATVRALKLHGGADARKLCEPDPAKVQGGLANLERHVDGVRLFGETPIVALNHFADDTDEEIDVVRRRCDELGLPFAVSRHHALGGQGAEQLARVLVEQADRHDRPFRPLYELEASVEEKVRTVARRVYGAREVSFSREARRNLADVRRLGYDRLPVCIAKTAASLSDDPRLLGRPEGFDINVRKVRINSGAGFLVILTGEIQLMPGLPSKARAGEIDLVDGQIVGLS